MGPQTLNFVWAKTGSKGTLRAVKRWEQRIKWCCMGILCSVDHGKVNDYLQNDSSQEQWGMLFLGLNTNGKNSFHERNYSIFVRKVISFKKRL